MKLRVQKAPRKSVDIEQQIDDIIMRFCYHYPRYTFKEASKMPLRRVRLMLNIAAKEHAKTMLELVHIAAAPHTKKGSGVKKLVSHYQSIIEK